MNARPMTHEQAVDAAAGYVLGALERDEEAAVRDHLATCPLPHPEFDELGGTVAALIGLEDLALVEPPDALRVRIMAAAAADLAANPRPASGSITGAVSPAASVATGPTVASAGVATASGGQTASPSEPTAATVPSTPIAFPSPAERSARLADRARSRTSRLDWALRVAAVIAIVAVGGWGLNLQRQLDAAQSFDRAVASVVQAAAQPGALTVALAPSKDSRASGIAAVGTDGVVAMAIRDLPATTGSQVYEAWVIVGNAKPVAVGGFTVDGNGRAAFRTQPAAAPPGSVIALTLEPRAGNTVPEGPVVAAGHAAPPASS